MVNPSSYWILSVNNESLAEGESAYEDNPGPKVWDMKRESLSGYGVFFLLARSEWPESNPDLPHLQGMNVPRGVFVALFHTDSAQLDSADPVRLQPPRGSEATGRPGFSGLAP